MELKIDASSRGTPATRWGWGLFCAAALGAPGALSAQEIAAIQAVATRPVPVQAAATVPAKAATSTSTSLLRFLSETKPSFNLRVRSEFADQKGLDKGVAYTARARIGLTTPTFFGFQGFAELEHNEGFKVGRSNGIVQGDPTKSSVADPESTELNQGFLSYSARWGQLKLGRQKIVLGEGVFVGDIDFRQNGQTFDALSASVQPTERLDLFYSYIYNVNRLFGSGDGKDLNSDSRSSLVQASYTVSDLLKARVFGYLFDLKQSGRDGLSTSTLGISLTGSRILGGARLSYRADTATQTEAADSPLDYRARYYYLSASVAAAGVELTAGREVFGSDRGIGFANTLDTTFRDLFITTPANGLTDDFAQIGFALPIGLSAQVQYHDFGSASGGRAYGQQVQGVVRQALTKNIAVLVRGFNYRDEDPAPMSPVGTLPPDTFRYSVQVDFLY